MIRIDVTKGRLTVSLEPIEEWVCEACGVTVAEYADWRYSRMGRPLCAPCYEQLGGDSDAREG